MNKAGLNVTQTVVAWSLIIMLKFVLTVIIIFTQGELNEH